MNTKPKLKEPTHYESAFDYNLALIKNGHLKLSDDLLVARIDIKQTHGSIILPDSAQLEQNTATILCVASNLSAADYPLGAHIIPDQSKGRELVSKGNERLVIYDVKTDIHAVFLPE